MKRGRAMVNLVNGTAQGITPSPDGGYRYQLGKKCKHAKDFETDSSSNDTTTAALKGAIVSLDLEEIPQENSTSKCHRFLKSMQTSERLQNYKPKRLFQSERQIDFLEEFQKKDASESTGDIYNFEEGDYVLQELQNVDYGLEIEMNNSNFDNGEKVDATNFDLDHEKKSEMKNDVSSNCQKKTTSSRSTNSDPTCSEIDELQSNNSKDPDYEVPFEFESSDSNDDENGIDEINNELNETTKNLNDDSEGTKTNKLSDNSQGNKTNGVNEKSDTDPKLKVTQRKKKIWDKTDLCPFCFEEITHFARHLQRKHKDEQEVENIIKLDKKDPERKKLYDALRKTGNFKLMSEKGVYCPVRRPDSEQQAHKDEYVPCHYCLGLYKKKSLFRHNKRCASRPNCNRKGKANPVGESQTLMALHYRNHGSFLINSRLRSEVFPIMTADEISEAVKSDPLICIYGESYLAKHKRVQLRNKASNDLREFGRLLIAIKSFTTVKCMMDVLDPTLFSSVVEAVKIISGYSTEDKYFESASLALHMRTSLDHMGAIAEKVVLQKHKLFTFEDHDAKLKSIKNFRRLICDHFASEVSSLALKQLNENKWTKRQAIPKTSNIEIFNNYLKNKAELAYSELEKNENNEFYYTQLVNASFALTVLINRKRIGEVQFLTIDTYEKDYSQINMEEFHRCLSSFEIALSSKFKRVITSGKGSRPVPILFPKKLEKYVNRVIEIRKTAKFVSGKNGEKVRSVNKTNPYVFALPETDRWLSGYNVIIKLAKASQIDEPNLMTSTRFRKHMATIVQLLNYDQSEMQQLATFMGHTLKTHEEFYRLPEDVYQTSKVAKVLMVMDEGKGEKYRGTRLKDIELDHNLLEDENQNEKTSEPSRDDQTEDHVENTQTETIVTSKGVRKRWNEKQKNAMKKYFRKYIDDKKAPNKKICEKFLENNDEFNGRDWVTVKTFVYNYYRDH